MLKTTFDVHGITIQLSTQNNEFCDFIRENYPIFKPSQENSTDIEINFGETALINQEDIANYRNIGENIQLSSNSIYWRNEFGFHILVEKTSDRIEVNAFHKELLEGQEPEEEYKNFQRCMRWAVHYPLFTLLQYQRGWNLLHGAAVTNGEKTFAFCGLNKVGKSTLATYLCEEYGYNILTDNFLLFDNEKIYAFPEVIRLGTESVEKFGLEPLWDHTVYNKHHISPTELGVTSEAKPNAFFILSQGSELRSQHLEPKNAWQTMENLNSMLGEFPQQNYMAAWPLISGQTRERVHTDMPIFDTSWHLLEYEPNWDLDATIGEVFQCI